MSADKERRYVVDQHGSADCRKWAYVCTPPVVTKFAIYCGGATIVAFFLAYVFYLHRAFCMLRTRAYSSFRVGNVLLRLQARPCPAALWPVPVPKGRRNKHARDAVGCLRRRGAR